MADYRFEVPQNVGCANPKRTDALKAKRFVARNIPLRPNASVMRLAIDFDRKPGVPTKEIQHVGGERMLASELQPTRTRSVKPALEGQLQ